MATPGKPAVVLPVYNEGATVGCVLDAVRRVFDATDSLEERIAELERTRAELVQRAAVASELASQVGVALGRSSQPAAEPVSI